MSWKVSNLIDERWSGLENAKCERWSIPPSFAEYATRSRKQGSAQRIRENNVARMCHNTQPIEHGICRRSTCQYFAGARGRIESKRMYTCTLLMDPHALHAQVYPLSQHQQKQTNLDIFKITPDGEIYMGLVMAKTAALRKVQLCCLNPHNWQQWSV